MSILPLAKRATWFSIIALVFLVSPSVSADTVLDIKIGGDFRGFERAALLARPDVTTVEIAEDVAYGKAMRLSVIECFETDGGVNYGSGRLI